MRRFLVMHAAQGTLFEIELDIALNQPRVESVFLKFLLAPRAGKKAATIPSLIDIHDVGTAQACFFENQRSPFRDLSGLTRPSTPDCRPASLFAVIPSAPRAACTWSRGNS